MGTKPEVRGAKKSRAKAPLSAAKEKSQRERFIEAAREVGVDETGGEFERALRTIVRPRRPEVPSK